MFFQFYGNRNCISLEQNKYLFRATTRFRQEVNLDVAFLLLFVVYNRTAYDACSIV